MIAAQPYRGAFLIQRGAFRRGDLQVSHQPGLVAVVGDVQGLFGGLQRRVLRLVFDREEILSREIILDFRERGQNHLPLVRHHLIVGGFVQTQICPELAALEQRKVQGGSD